MSNTRPVLLLLISLVTQVTGSCDETCEMVNFGMKLLKIVAGVMVVVSMSICCSRCCKFYTEDLKAKGELKEQVEDLKANVDVQKNPDLPKRKPSYFSYMNSPDKSPYTTVGIPLLPAIHHKPSPSTPTQAVSLSPAEGYRQDEHIISSDPPCSFNRHNGANNVSVSSNNSNISSLSGAEITTPPGTGNFHNASVPNNPPLSLILPTKSPLHLSASRLNNPDISPSREAGSPIDLTTVDIQCHNYPGISLCATNGIMAPGISLSTTNGIMAPAVDLTSDVAPKRDEKGFENVLNNGYTSKYSIWNSYN